MSRRRISETELPSGLPNATKDGTRKLIRCATYTRKSSEEGLEQEFNSLDAQREGAQSFIASQKAEGWACLPDAYDDGGFSGGSMELPALERLLRDVEAGKGRDQQRVHTQRLEGVVPEAIVVVRIDESHH